MINAKVNLAHVHVEATAKDDATLVAEAAVMFLVVARSIVDNANDAELVHFVLTRVTNDVAKRIEKGEFDDFDGYEETETETETENDDDFENAIELIAKKIAEELKKS